MKLVDDFSFCKVVYETIADGNDVIPVVAVFGKGFHGGNMAFFVAEKGFL